MNGRLITSPCRRPIEDVLLGIWVSGWCKSMCKWSWVHLSPQKSWSRLWTIAKECSGIPILVFRNPELANPGSNARKGSASLPLTAWLTLSLHIVAYAHRRGLTLGASWAAKVRSRIVMVPRIFLSKARTPVMVSHGRSAWIPRIEALAPLS